MGPNRKSVIRLAAAALLAAGAASAAANVLVIRSSGPSAGSYPAGRSLPDNMRLSLKANDVVTILANGATRTFRGPGTFSPDLAVQASVRTASASDGRRARIGAVRNAGLVPRSPTIWHVDVGQSGNFCLAGTADVKLWRADSSASSSLEITAPDGQSQAITWPAGESVTAWPSSLPITNEGEYRLRQQGVAVPVRISFRTLDSEPTDLETVARALIANDCQEQLDLLVETTAEEEG